MFTKKKKEQEELIEDIYLDLEDEALSNEDVQPEESDYELTDSPTPPKKKLPAWVIVPVIVVFGLVVFGVSKLSSGNTKNQNAALQVAEVTTDTIKEVYNASGKIESEDTKTYYSPVTAPIDKCNAEVGNVVKTGDLLVSFDTTNLERDNQQAQLTLQSNQNASASAKAKNAQAIDAANATSAQAADTANRLAEKVDALAAKIAEAEQAAGAVGTQLETLNVEIEALSRSVTENETLINNVNATYDRTQYTQISEKPEQERTPEEQSLFTALKKVYDPYDEASAKLPDLRIQLSQKQAERDSLAGSVTGLTALQTEYDTMYAQWETAYAAANAPTVSPGMTEAELAGLNISDNLAELTALTPAQLVEKGKEGLKSDMNGVIASVELQQTNTATQGMALFSVASMEKVRVKIEVSPDDYDKMKIGNTATVKVGEYKYNGTLTKVNKIAIKNEKGNPVIAAEIRISNPDENLCIGATAKVTMTVAEANNVLSIPTEVINTSSDGDFVYVIENGIVEKRTVELGTSSTTKIEVKSGLKKGDQVVTDLNVDIKEGMAATAMPSADSDKKGKSTDDSTTK